MLTKEELQKMIDQLDYDELKRLGMFGIYTYGGDTDESFIRANKEGLELFALELLRAARELENLPLDKEQSHVPFFFDEEWFDNRSDTVIHYIESVDNNHKINAETKQRIGDKFIPLGCLFLILVLLICILVGGYTIVHWLI